MAGTHNPLLPEMATVIETVQETHNIKTFRVRFDDEEKMKNFTFQPGQVGQLSVFGVGESTFVINSSPTRMDYLQFSVMKAGENTAALHKLNAGDKIGVRAPLGNWFPYDQWKGKNVFFIGGGIGMAPIRTIMVYLLDNRKDYGDISLLYGAKTPADLSFQSDMPEWLERKDLNVTLTIDNPAEGWEHKDGLIPNVFSADGNHAYNSADASLWYVWAVQQMLKALPDRKRLVRERCWPVIKNIIEHYGGGKVPFVTPDAEGFLSVGNPGTQLTWMDAVANGRPVTPRHGQPVEISALWYNALAFADSLAKAFGEPEWRRTKQLDAMRAVFFKRYWVTDERGDYLADVWRDGGVETCVRPNQLFALSLPYPVLDEERYVSVLSRVRRCLLTPYGLRTLAPSAPGYRPLYEGGPAERDEAYHQGTVWPWLLGAYGEAVLRAAWDVPGSVRELLRTIRPLFAQHLGDAGIGSVSEIFDGDPPHLPNGCIAQAWSVAECLRLLYLLKEAAPGIYAEWEANARKGGN